MWVISISVAIAVLSLAYMFYLRFGRQPVPLWDKVALAYGGIFVAFFVIDTAAAETARFRREKDQLLGRPQPVPAPGREVVLPVAGRPDVAGDVSIRPVGDVLRTAFVDMASVAIAEVLALDGRRPTEAAGLWVENMLADPNNYCFVVVKGEEPTGAGVLQSEVQHYELLLFYIASVYRRSRIGTRALLQLTDFARLLNRHSEVLVRVSANNARAQTFFRACGFVLHGPAGDTDSEVAKVTLIRRVGGD